MLVPEEMFRPSSGVREKAYQHPVQCFDQESRLYRSM